MADLQSRIADLQTDFQRIASLHPWVCLAIPPLGGEASLLLVGELFGPPWPKLDLPGVREPECVWDRTIVDHVTTLTMQARKLLFAVLEEHHQIPPDVVADIREWERQTYGLGWVRWLWFVTRPQHVHRYENYPQVAATALRALRDMLNADQGQEELAAAVTSECSADLKLPLPAAPGESPNAPAEVDNQNLDGPFGGSEGGPPKPDVHADLRQFARARLKGQERAVIEALCDTGGELPIADLVVKDGVSWDEPFQGFRNAQQRLNPKLKSLGWTLARQNNAAKLNPMKSESVCN